MNDHFPVLQVVLPLLAAPLCVLLHRPRAAWAIFFVTSLAATGIAISLLATVLRDGPLNYALGGWAPPFGIEYVIDAASAGVLLLVSGIALACACLARDTVAREIPADRIYLFYACLCLCMAGLLGITATGDAFNVFVFLEISSLSGYALIAMGRRRQALLAAFQYLVIGTVGGTFLLVSLGLAYALTGTLNMADMATRIDALPPSPALGATVAFACIGLAIKAAVFPLHAWLPGAYAESPGTVASFLSGTGTKVALYALARFTLTVFGAGLVFGNLAVQQMGLMLGSIGMLAGAVVACREHDLRRILAWSSVGQIGYIVVGLSLATAEGVSAAMLHLFAHGVIKAALFALATVLVLGLGGARLSELGGLARRSPFAFAALLFGGLGLIGVPGTAGFASKWALVLALIESGQIAVLVCVLLSSLLAVIYVWRVVEAAWFGKAEPQTEAPSMPGATTAILALSLISAAIGLGVLPAGILADAAATALLGSGR